jgi:hypothetical protein
MARHDYLGDRAANFRLIQQIVAWWRKRGFEVRAWLEKGTAGSNGATIWVIRTNIKQDARNVNPRYTIG